MLAFHTGSTEMQKKLWSYHWSRVELGDDMVEEGCKVGRARLELLDAVKAVALAVWLKQRRYNIVKIIILESVRYLFYYNLSTYMIYLLLVWIKIIILSSNDLWDDAGDGGTAHCGRGKRVLGVEDSKPLWNALYISTLLKRNVGSYQVGGVFCIWRVAGVEAVSGCALWAGEGWLFLIEALWRSADESTRHLKMRAGRAGKAVRARQPRVVWLLKNSAAELLKLFILFVLISEDSQECWSRTNLCGCLL